MGLTPSRFAQRLSRASARIGPWPRRLAALVCLLLAAGTALSPPPGHPGRPTARVTRLQSGEVALPVAVTAAGIELVKPGTRIGLLAAHRLLADRLRVIAVHTAEQSVSGDPADSVAVVVVAVDRSQAETIAGASSDRLALIADELP